MTSSVPSLFAALSTLGREDASVRHIGPFAEDFLRLFGLGDGQTIATVDADGVLMAAVQGLLRRYGHRPRRQGGRDRGDPGQGLRDA